MIFFYVCVVLLLSVPAGYIRRFGLRHFSKGAVIRYLSSPVTHTFTVNWTTRQVLALYSDKAAQRWYESRAHLKQGVFISLLCALRLLYVVKIDFLSQSRENGHSRVFYFNGLRSYENILLKHDALIDQTAAQMPSDTMYYQTFVAGYNVVSDYSDRY